VSNFSAGLDLNTAGHYSGRVEAQADESSPGVVTLTAKRGDLAVTMLLTAEELSEVIDVLISARAVGRRNVQLADERRRERERKARASQ
jgi:hypothetical protein